MHISDQYVNQFRSTFNQLRYSKYKCGFRKGFSTQHYVLAIIEKLRKSFDSGQVSVALLTDFSRLFDCLTV